MDVGKDVTRIDGYMERPDAKSWTQKSPRGVHSVCARRGDNYLTEMCSDSEEGSYFKAHRLVYHSTLGARVIKKRKKGERVKGGLGKGWKALALLSRFSWPASEGRGGGGARQPDTPETERGRAGKNKTHSKRVCESDRQGKMESQRERGRERK